MQFKLLCKSKKILVHYLIFHPYHLWVLLLLTQCNASKGEKGYPLVTRSQILKTAESYRQHVWTPRQEHIKHGRDDCGIEVHTPDLSYREHTAAPGHFEVGVQTCGIPYQWGGFCSLDEFDQKLKLSFYAGDVSTRYKRQGGDSVVSQRAVGIDCSGFVSRCWGLPHPYSTREIEQLCEPILSALNLKPGDIFNRPGQHVLLFAQWLDEKKGILMVYETGGPPDWRVCCHSISLEKLNQLGYKPFRYLNVRDKVPFYFLRKSS